MKSTEFRNSLSGIIPPLVTPFNEEGQVDYELFRKETIKMIASGVSGISVGGSTGEGETLSDDELRQMSQIAVEEADGKVIVLGGIITNSTIQAIRKGMIMKETGVDALMITPIHYLFNSGDQGNYMFYKEIYKATKMPVIVYNVVPWNVVSTEILKKLGSEGIIAGVKQSGGDIHALGTLLVESKDIMPILTAIDDMMMPSFVLGAKGGICAINTILPKTSVKLFKAVKDRKLEVALSLHEAILPIFQSILLPDMPSRIKFAMNHAGWEVGYSRRPLLEPTSEVADDLITKAKNVYLMEGE